MPSDVNRLTLIRSGIVLIFMCCAYTRAWGQSTEPARTAATVQVPEYPDSAQGLTSLAQDVLAAISKSDTALTNAYMKALILPNPDSWFADAFEKDLARESAAEYTEITPSLPMILTASFRNIKESGASVVKAYRFESTCDPEMDGNIIVLLSMRKRGKPLYEVRFSGGDVDRAIWAFAYVDEGFRYIGNTRLGFGSRLKELVRTASAADSQPKPDDSNRLRVKVGGNVAAAKITHQVPPIYPSAAKENHVQGTVVLHAIIGPDGAVQQIQVKQGPCMLDEAAIRAVRQWRYSPTLINGKPVEVDTTISVIFTLSY